MNFTDNSYEHNRNSNVNKQSYRERARGEDLYTRNYRNWNQHIETEEEYK